MRLFDPKQLLTFAVDDPQLVKALNKETRAYLAATEDHRYADKGMWLKAGVLLLACQGFYLAALFLQSGIGFFVCYLAMMMCAMLLVINVVHDASHNAFLRGEKANAWLNRVIAIPLGMDPDCWRVRHVLFHHHYTNIDSYDPDTAENGLLRQMPQQRWRAFMRWQRFYWPVVAALTFPWYIWVMDWLDRGGFTPVTRHLAQQGISGWCCFLSGKLAHLVFCVFIPVWLLAGHLSLMAILGIYFLCQMISSMVFVTLIIGTHWAKGHNPQPSNDGKLATGKLAHAFATTCDWSVHPQWLGYWLGGFNLHLTHHLFPHWNHRHYPELSRISAQIARQQGLDYQQLSWSELRALQQGFLQRMGEQAEDQPVEN